MTNQEILEKVIQKAAGFNISVPHFAHPLEEYAWDDEGRYWFLGDITIPLFEIIYQHNFAKALWGERDVIISRYVQGNGRQIYGKEIYGWEMHLQQMVIAPDPIEYLGEHI